MTAADLPPTLRDRPFDHDRGWPVPFVHEYDDGTYDLDHLNPKRVTQCALSRVCAMCAQTLSFPLAFLGDEEEARTRTYAYPPMHEACAQAALRLYPPRGTSGDGAGDGGGTGWSCCSPAASRSSGRSVGATRRGSGRPPAPDEPRGSGAGLA